ncbi:MAG: TetR family transcriptional regulator, partial [Tabrizicola sp.]|nr:TetR family transcriptional regulator [Tabrizicola sp.]
MGESVATDQVKPPRTMGREQRRAQLIEATIDSLAKRGFAETTMADVADGAGLSRGIVNFHFESKEKLLVATLQYMADEYAAHWRSALMKAGEDPARQLAVLVAAD